jgi:hypothetical protein
MEVKFKMGGKGYIQNFDTKCFGRSNSKWQDNIKMDFTEINCNRFNSWPRIEWFYGIPLSSRKKIGIVTRNRPLYLTSHPKSSNWTLYKYTLMKIS